LHTSQPVPLGEAIINAKIGLGHLLAALRFAPKAGDLEIHFSMTGDRQFFAVVHRDSGMLALDNSSMDHIQKALARDPALVHALNVIAQKTRSDVTLQVPLLTNGRVNMEALELSYSPKL
jgi:hypothetical protein